MHGETLPLDMREAMMPYAKAWNRTKLLQATKVTIAYCRRIPVYTGKPFASDHTLSPPHARIPPHTHTDEHTHTHTITTNICTTTLAPCHTHTFSRRLSSRVVSVFCHSSGKRFDFFPCVSRDRSRTCRFLERKKGSESE